jgi:hypothetical protein
MWKYNPDRLNKALGRSKVCVRPSHLESEQIRDSGVTAKLPAMSSKQTVLDRELFVQALRHMGEEDLLFLSRMVVERLNLLAQARSTVQLAQFAEGDRVAFTTQDGSIKVSVR